MSDATRAPRESAGRTVGRPAVLPISGPGRPPENNMPLALSSFIGREKELAEIGRLLAGGTRLLTLTGPGGCGKTRLSLEVAHGLAGELGDGVSVVELAPLSDPELVPQTVAFTLGVREVPGRPLTETLRDHLKVREMLLVLDNCEHVVEACAPLAEELLGACPGVRVLATSREPLGVSGETGWPVPSLSLPEDPRYPLPVADLSRYEATRLFVERASSVLPGFEATQENAAAIARVCRGLDGMPLAIELAAARVKVLTVEEISARLDDRFRLLTGGSRTAAPRQQTLRATMDWSHGLLSEKERVVFRRLSVFAGEFTLGAAEGVGVGAGIEREEVLEQLSRLVDKSLVVVRRRGGEARYRLLETVRQYGREKLEQAGETPGEAEDARRRHADYFLARAEETAPRIEPNIGVAARRPWLEGLETEHDDLRAALRWARHASPQTGLRLANALYWFWYHGGYWSEGRAWYERELAGVSAEARTEARAEALCWAGYLAWVQGDHATARTRLEESVAMWRGLGGGQGVLAHALWILGLEMLSQGEPAAARSLAEESVEIFRAIGGDGFGLSISLATLGAILLGQGDLGLATRVLEESATISREARDGWMLSLPLRNLGVVALKRGDHDRAAELIKESLCMLGVSGDRLYVSRNLECLAVVDARRGDHARAGLLFGAGEALREAIGASAQSYLVDYEGAVGAARDALGEVELAAAWARGREMTPEQAVAYALGETPLTDHPQPAARLEIFALGQARVERDGQELAPSDWTYARSRELLFYLLSHPDRTKEQIGLALWPDASPAQLRGGLHRTLHHLRRALGGPGWISFHKGRYSFDRSLPYFFDVEEFENGLAEARRHGAEAPELAIRHLERAVGLWRGDFLEDLAQSEWALQRREELRREYHGALLTLGRLLFAEGRYAEAAGAYRIAIAHDGFLEAAHRGLMRCLARLGERSQALRHYQALLETLRDELGTSPAPETAELHRSLLQNKHV